MGRVTSEPSTITHFSHLHPLQLFTVPHHHHQTLTLTLAWSCSGCNLQLFPGDDSIYCCTSCNFFLHASCSKLPMQITHPVDQLHVLSLIPTPMYPQGFFNCDACGTQGTGFSYHCGVCNIDLHSTCASMPVSRTHPTHPHYLTLAFSPPYPNNSFSCDICRNPGSNHWLYRCHHCQFDSHLSCAADPTTTNPRSFNNHQPAVVPQILHHQVNAQNYIRYPAVVQPQYVHMSTVPSCNMSRQQIQGFNRPNQLQGLLRANQALMRGFLGGGGGGDGGGGSDHDGGGDGGGFDNGGFGDMGNSGGFEDAGSMGDFDFI